MLIQTINTERGEINVYRDADGYHAEVWDDARQLIIAQSGDCATAKAAIATVRGESV